MTAEQEQIIELIKNIISSGPINIHNMRCFKSKAEIAAFAASYKKWFDENIHPQIEKLEKTL